MRTNREKYLKFNRPPRKKLVVPDKQVIIPDPPEAQSSEPKINYLMMMAPVVTASVVGFGIGMISGNFLMSMIMVSGSLIYATFTFVTKKREIKAYRENIKRIDEVYKQRIAQTKDELKELRKRQVLTLNKNYPDKDTLKKWTIQADERLWERRPADDDFLVLRFATGKQPAITQIKVPSADFLELESSLVQSAHVIKKEYSRDLEQVPIVLDLKKLGALAITGKAEDSEKLAARLLCDLAVLHYPGEVDLFAVCEDSSNSEDQDKKTRWDWLKWLPHTRAVSSLGEKPHIAFNADTTKSILDQLLEEYTNRSTRKEGYSKSIVLFVQDYAIVQGQESISVLLRNGSAYGIYLIIGVPGLRQVPDGCGGALEVDGTAAVLQFLKSGEKSLQGRAEFAENSDCEIIARNLIKVSRGDSSFDLPSDIRFLELVGYESAEKVDFEQLWEQAWQQKQPCLETIIGVKRGKQNEVINLRQHAHGPHGLIAGTTRSGKSELLQTILAGLALKHHPHQLNFVLVDYKGGTSLSVLENLPHTVGLVTDLDGRQTLRALAALERELERREEILAKYQVADLDKYYQQGYAEKETLPYLLIVIDEFAELRNKFRDDFQAVMGRFVSLAQRGGGLGVHLMLAMQSPEGVVDDKIRANTKYRICLRVESDGESRSLLQKPDAARITVQGRGYFQVGKDIVYDLFQVARVAGYYHQDESGEVENEYKIFKIMPDGHTEVLIDSTSERSKEKKASKTDVQLLVANAQNTAKRLKLKKLNSPWPPALPSVLPLSQVLGKAELTYWHKQSGWPQTSAHDEKWMAVPIGLLDEPKKQKQPPLMIDLMGDGTNTFVMGAPAQGKTNFLLTLATSLALRYAPDDINLHLIDFSTGQLESIAQFPHVAGRYRLNEKEKVQRLLYILQKELVTRQEMCNEANVPDLQALLRQKPDAKLPVILTLIDNFPKFREIFQMEASAWESLMRDGGKYGLCFAFVSDKLPSDNFLNLARARGAFYLTDHSYSSFVGHVDKTLEEQLPGRGFWVGKPPLQFHFALPTDGTPIAQLSNLQDLMKEMRTSWKGDLPVQVELLGDVEFSEILLGNADTPAFKPLETGEDFQIPIALDYATHQPVSVNLFRESPYYLVIGPQGSGDVASLMAMVLSTAFHYRPEDVQFALIGGRKDGVIQLKDIPHVIHAAVTPSQINETLIFIDGLAKERREALKDKSPDYYFKPVTILVVDDYARFGKTVEQKLLDKLSESLTGRGHMLGIGMMASVTSVTAKNLRGDMLFRQIKESRNGLFLSPADATNADFSDIVKVPEYMRGRKDLPAGRGILYNPGASPQPFVHVAMLGMNNPEIVALWVEHIKKRSPSISPSNEVATPPDEVPV